MGPPVPKSTELYIRCQSWWCDALVAGGLCCPACIEIIGLSGIIVAMNLVLICEWRLIVDEKTRRK